MSERAARRTGRPWVSDRAAFTAIVFVLVTGVPLLATHTAANRNDVTHLLPLVDGIAPIAGKPGRPRRRPDRVIADRGYDHDKYRRQLWARGVKPIIAPPRHRARLRARALALVVERTFAWLHNFRRLRIRWERDPALHTAFLCIPPFSPSDAPSSAGATSPRSETGSKGRAAPSPVRKSPLLARQAP